MTCAPRDAALPAVPADPGPGARRRMTGVSPDPPPPILVGPEGSFAWDVFHRRHPVLIENLIDALPYGPGQAAALRRLLAETRGGVIEPLRPGAPDAARWAAWDRGHYGKPWAETPFLWAEGYFYRRVLEATGHRGHTAWRDVDPYGPMKEAELADPHLDAAFAWTETLPALEPAARLRALIEAAVLGNRADLGFRLTGSVEGYTALNPPLADDTDRALRRLAAGAPRAVAILCDNAGRELLTDLLLARELLAAGAAPQVELHVKPAPTYVSDATGDDVGRALRRLRAMPGEAGQAGRELFRHAAAGRLSILTHPFWCAPLPFDEMPGDLRARLAGAFLVVKGDLNYRRLVGDRRWDPATPFADAAARLGAPLMALRTLKSDAVAGLDAARVARLDATEPDWRVNGRHTLVQSA